MMINRHRQYLPVLLDVTRKNILMIGAGSACAAKLKSLSELQKEICVISPDFHRDFLNKKWIQKIDRKYRPGDLKGYQIIYCGVNDPKIQTQIMEEAKAEHALVNFVDHVEESDFISPSSLIKKNFAIFISTFGRGPGITKKIRQKIEEKIDLDALDREAEEYIQNRTQKKG